MTEFRKAFIDTSPFIYLIEENEHYFDKVYRIFESFYTQKKNLVTSAITVEEYCVYPMRCHDDDLIKGFEELIEKLNINVCDINRDLAFRAARIRAEYKDFKAMDALQLSVAMSTGCDIFLTNDKQLKQYKKLKVLTIDDFDI